MDQRLIKIGIILILLGIALIVLSTVLLGLRQSAGGETAVAGCIVIFFIPICFGYGDYSLLLPLIIAMIILVLVLILLPLILAKYMVPNVE